MAAEPTDNENQNPDTQPTVVTIPADGNGMPENSSELKTGDNVCIYGKITANDDQGLSVEVTKTEKMDAPEDDEVQGAGDAPEGEGDEQPTASATDYVKNQRKSKMGVM
jgi:hypothetical protein